MSHVFVFAEQVRMALKSGKKEIDIPQGARISAAAMELINDHKIEVHFSVGQPKPIGKRAMGKSVSARNEIILQPKTEAVPIKKPLEAATDELPPDIVEEIVNRVIDRFYQIKGRTPGKTERDKNDLPKEKEYQRNDDLVICRCEEITKEEIRDAIKNGIHTLNGIKRVTRAGMGLCQGQTCQRLVTQLLAEELGIKPMDIEPTTARGPVRPVHLAVFANS